MKNALSLYIELLAERFTAYGAVTQIRDAGAEARKVWKLLAAQMAEELEDRQLAAVASEIIASSPKARAALLSLDSPSSVLRPPSSAFLAADHAPIADALAKIKAKTVVPSTLRSADWADTPTQIREVSQFSAGVASARVMGAIQSRLTADVGWDFSQPKGREAFIRDMREVMQAEGVGWESVKGGSLLNPQSNTRLGLIYDQQTRSARGYAACKIAMDRDLLQEVPAQELVREAEARVARDWPRIWTAKGGVLRNGRMAALKTDGIWTAISRFGVPWPPFDFGSHMGLRDLLRDEAEALGLISPEETLDPEPVPDYAAGVQASVSEIPEQMLGWLRSAFGNRIEIDGDVVRMSGKGA